MKKLAIVVALLLLSGAGVASATTLDVMNVNTMTTTAYGDFFVQSLELNAQCGAAGDPRCTPYTANQYPVASSPGAISSQLVIYMNSNGNNNTPTPFPNASDPTCVGPCYDNPFRSPTGSQDTTFDMSSANEPGTGGTVVTTSEFTGDIIGTWQIQIKDLLTYLNGHDLVFIFDNNETGNDNQFQDAWGQVSITDAAGNVVGSNCWTLTLGTTGCVDPSTVPTSDFVPIAGDFCVDAITGAAYNIGTATNAGDCTQNAGGIDYFITNNLGADSAEFVIFNLLLNAFIHDPANANLYLTVNLKLRDLEDGGEQLWICSDCDLPRLQVPLPSALILLGMGMTGFGVTRWRRSRRNA